MSLQESRTEYDGFTTLEGGMDSGRAPSLLKPNQSAFLINAQTRPGYADNRPGWYKVTTFGDNFQLGRWQTASPYISSGGDPFLVASIGGNIIRFNPITGEVLNLSTTAALQNAGNIPRAWFCQAETFLCIQDNSSLPLIFDGATLRRGKPIDAGGDEFPLGNVMEYNNGRLWVALPDGRSFGGGNLAYSETGDASDVLKWTQNQFLVSGSFALPSTAGFITAMKSIANQDSVLGQGPLVVFGQYGAATVNAPFDVTLWQNTNSPIVSLGILSPGPAGQDAALAINGDIWYRAQDGIRSFMIARRDWGTWVNTALSHEVERILNFDDQYLLKFVSEVDFDNRLLTTCSPFRATYDGVEYGVAFRGLTALDFTRVTSMFERTSPTWEGLWNGLDILQILKVNCYGKDRCFMFVLNECHQIELWELSVDNRFDNMTDPIESAMETRAMGFKDQSEFLKQLVRPEIWFESVIGTSPYEIKYRPDGAPLWQDLDSGINCAKTGMCSPPSCTNPVGPFQQYRARQIGSAPDESDCEECNDKKYMNGFEFQFRITWSSARIRRFRAVATDVEETVTGGCFPTEDSCCEESGCSVYPFSYETPNPC